MLDIVMFTSARFVGTEILNLFLIARFATFPARYQSKNGASPSTGTVILNVTVTRTESIRSTTVPHQLRFEMPDNENDPSSKRRQKVCSTW